MARFDNKVVLVSGGARGQGAAEARLLVAQGAKVVIGDVLDNLGQSLAVELGPAASFVRHDVTSEADWARAVEAAEKLGGLHGLVNNAGIYQPAALMETDDALWRRHIQINQYGCFLGMKAVVPAMERSGGGSIVNISSVAGLTGSPGTFAYAVTDCAPTGHSGRPSGPIDRVCALGPMASCATVTPPINPAHYTHESGGPAAAPLLEVSRSVPSSHGAVDAVRFSAARQFSPGARIAQAAEQGRK